MISCEKKFYDCEHDWREIGYCEWYDNDGYRQKRQKVLQCNICKKVDESEPATMTTAIV